MAVCVYSVSAAGLVGGEALGPDLGYGRARLILANRMAEGGGLCTRISRRQRHADLPGVNGMRSGTRLLLMVLALWGAGFADGAYASGRLELAYPGDTLYQENRPKKTKLSTWVAQQRWSALSVRDGVLHVEPVTETTQSDWVSVAGKDADYVLAKGAFKRPPKSAMLALKPPTDAVVLARIDLDNGASAGFDPGAYPGYIAPAVLREGWTASAEVAGRKWKFYTRHEKRTDGKMLAGSLEIMADDGSNQEPMVLLPKASGMAFARQELLWLGDLNGDMEPDLLLKRTRLTGDIDIVVVAAHRRGLTYHDPDQPITYFSSGVEPESNGFSWNRKSPLPVTSEFVAHGSFSIDEEEWKKKMYPQEQPSPMEPPALPVLLADRQFKWGGETIRFTLEHLPRASNHHDSSASESTWGGSVVVRAFFRGKSQALMEAEAPDSGQFTLSIGMIGNKPGIKVDHQPHYNNGFTRHWIYDKNEARFRRLSVVHSQGC